MVWTYYLVILLMIILSGMIVKEDFQNRQIHLGWLIGLFILGNVYGWQFAYLPLSWVAIGLNLAFIGLQLLLISLYFSLKMRRWVNITKTLLGWGDIVFFLVLCFILPTLHLIWFYTLSLLIVLVGFLIYQSFKPIGERTIPLAGGMSACLIMYLIVQVYSMA